MATKPIDELANELLISLTADADFEVPDIDLSGPEYEIPGGTDSAMYQPVDKLTNEDLTTRTVGGSGTFDALMDGFKAHLVQEYNSGRITGAEYTKAYVALVGEAMGNATSFLLGRDQAFWNAVTAQAQAIIARINLQTAKVQLASLQLEALTRKANYALTKAKLSTESGTFAVVTEQYEVQRAQTQNTRSDGSAVEGTLGKQRELYTQQITSYQRDAEVKAAKLFTDAWITQKTIDEGLEPPTNFANASLNEILGVIKVNNNLEE